MSGKDPLVSVIMPVYNGQQFVAAAIQSVLDQTYTHWELLIINDGSTDESGSIINAFADARIRYFTQENKGVSAARNVGLDHMAGDYFCFLDADDVLPVNSFNSRIKVFKQDTSVGYVDGTVHRFRLFRSEIIEIWKPKFFGNPIRDLVRLTGKSFFGVTWMIRRNSSINYKMKEGLTHGEDLLFYIDIVSRDKSNYAYINEVILLNRIHDNSAMNSLDGLKRGYHFIYRELHKNSLIEKQDIKIFRRRVNRILFLSYIKNRALISAFKSLL